MRSSSPPAKSWAAALGLYFTAMRSANRSPGTIRLHRFYLAHLSAQHPNPWRVTTADLRELMAQPTWGPASMKSARTVYRGFYRWAHGEGLVDDWIGERLASVRVRPGVPRPAPELVVQRVQHDVDRIAFMAQLGAFAGLRAGEISRVGSWDLDVDVLTVHGKGGKTRVVPIEHQGLLERLEDVADWAFPNQWTGKPITPGYVTKLLSDALPDGWTAHNLRHRYAMQAFDGTGDLLAVSELLGHASTATTQVYVSASVKRLRAAARAAA